MTEIVFHLTGELRIVAPNAERCEQIAREAIERLNQFEPAAHLKINKTEGGPLADLAHTD